jgi:hypothetical protein
MPANNLVCKFDPSHGLFITPVKLSEHYRDAHGDQWTPNPPNVKQYRCRLCHGVYRNPSSHVHQAHPAESPNRPYVGRIIDRIEDSAARPAGRHTPPPAVLNGHDIVNDEPAKTTPPRHVGPWTVDDIVLPVVEQLAAPRGLIPVAHLGAILAWREATADMLREVTGR